MFIFSNPINILKDVDDNLQEENIFTGFLLYEHTINKNNIGSKSVNTDTILFS